MRLALISDIHANLEALEAVLLDADRQGCTHAACIGDIVGYNADDHIETAKWYTNQRASSIGLGPVYEGAEHRFPWMSEQVSTRKEKNFFETRPTEYRTGGALSWDD